MLELEIQNCTIACANFFGIWHMIFLVFIVLNSKILAFNQHNGCQQQGNKTQTERSCHHCYLVLNKVLFIHVMCCCCVLIHLIYAYLCCQIWVSIFVFYDSELLFLQPNTCIELLSLCCLYIYIYIYKGFRLQLSQILSNINPIINQIIYICNRFESNKHQTGIDRMNTKNNDPGKLLKLYFQSKNVGKI